MHENPGLKKGCKKPLGSRNSREQHAPTARACELTREHRSLVTSHLLMRNKRLWNICQLGKNVFPIKRCQEYFKSYLLRVDPNLPCSTLFDS